MVSYPEPEAQQELLDSWVREYGQYETHVRGASPTGRWHADRVIRFLVITEPEWMRLEGDALVLETSDSNGRLFERAGSVMRRKPHGEPITLAEVLTGWPPPPLDRSRDYAKRLMYPGLPSVRDLHPGSREG
ncbi:hypothetical protein ABT294_25635 [Nonomuraea sp. NPDC000554]|uniref:hypothetical protein n=1 Tax=Nonomuraea sp. NPDC000554 TaxID=3154259 RepID=UPI003325C8DC